MPNQSPFSINSIILKKKNKYKKTIKILELKN